MTGKDGDRDMPNNIVFLLALGHLRLLDWIERAEGTRPVITDE